MTKVEITYNPFLVDTEITINGNPSKGPWKQYKETRLQQWLTELFPALVDVCNDDLVVTFRGTQLDFDDVKAAAVEYTQQHPDLTIEMAQPFIAPNAEPRMEQLKDLFQKLHNDCPFDDLRSDDVKKKFEEAMSSKFKVSVIATMSSGKSTLINAMLGRELMPAKNEACTATIASIEDNDELSDFEAVCKDEAGNVLFQSKPVTAEKMAEYNDDPHVSYIDLKGDIPFVTSQDMQLVLEDTPGPNNSRTEEHKKHTYKVIDEEAKPMVLYILNATQIGTNDDDYLLTRVANAMKVGGKQSRDRFLFVANKADAVDPDRESLPDMLQHVREYLEQHGIDNPSVYPVSAEFAKIIRLFENGQDELSKKQKLNVRNAPEIFSEDEDMHLESYAPLSPAIRASLHHAVQQLQQSEDEDAKLNEALIHTGVPGVEMAIREYLDKYALTNKIESAVQTFQKKIEDKKLMQDLLTDLRQDEGKREKLQQDIKRCEQLIQSGNTDKLEEQIGRSIEEVKKQINKNAESIFTQMNAQVARVDSNSEFPLDEASRLIANLMRQSKEIQSDLQSQLEKMIDDTVGLTAQKLIEDYNSQYQELLSGSISKSIGTSIDIAMSALPDSRDFVARYQNQKTWKEKTGEKWVKNDNWNPLSWFDFTSKLFGLGHNENVYKTHQKSYIKGSQINDEYISKILGSIDDNINDGKVEAIKRAKEFETWFRTQLKEIDKTVQEKITELKEATSSQKVLAKEIQENEAKVAWLNKFEEDLNKILSV